MITPETLIVGVDVAKQTRYAQMIDFRGEGLHKPFPFQNTISGISDLVQQIRTIQFKHGLSKVLVAMEPTGHYWLPLACVLKGQGTTVVLINPHHVKKAKELDDNSPTKRDDKDVGVIARLARGSFLHPAHSSRRNSEYPQSRQLPGAAKQRPSAKRSANQHHPGLVLP
jgi:transposase